MNFRNKKILVYDPKLNGSIPFPIQRELEVLGHEVLTFDFLQYFQNGQHLFNKVFNALAYFDIRRRINQDLLSLVRKEKFDLLIICYGKHLKFNTLKTIKNYIPVIVNWNGDDLFNKLNNSEDILKSIGLYDIHFTPRIHLEKEYKAHGAKKVIEMDWYYRTGYLDNQLNSTPKKALYFAGNHSPRRAETLNKINIESICVSGSGWDKESVKNYGFLDLNQMHQNFKNHAFNLNILTQENNDTSNLRNFEIPAYMGFQISERTEKIQSLFEEDKEIVLFDSIDELNDKIEFYSKNELSRFKIIRNSHERLIKSDYSLSARVKKIIESVNEL